MGNIRTCMYMYIYICIINSDDMVVDAYRFENEMGP
jgi:hypothetical protein